MLHPLKSIAEACLRPRLRPLAAGVTCTHLFNFSAKGSRTIMEQAPPKTEKKEKEQATSKKAADKAAKFAAKQAKLKQLPTATQSTKPAAAKAVKAAASTLSPYEEKTPPGQKKILQPLDHPHFQAYSPSAVEAGWYQWWEKSGFFKPEALGDKPAAGKFVIPLPPPNVTGALHCGHALANSLQDTLIRWYRMRGYSTLWVPGCDHASISTQSVVEKMLWKTQKRTRIEIGREKFTDIVWHWKEDYHQRINNAQRLLGGSMDWTREAFTMDENLSAATLETFCRLHNEGYIYRSNRLVNWCTKLNTAISSIEVENMEITGRTLISVPGYDKKVEFGVLTFFKYPIDGSAETIEVATTRPETMLGDSGIAVHPDDTRYAQLVGRSARHPFTDRLLPIVADKYVDPEFGTGAVKLTPAHDFNDYNLGKAHNLEFINILNEDGTLNSNAGPFAGQKRFDARYHVVEELTKLGLFVKKEPNPMKIPLCEKSKDVIEPLIKPQWWIRMKELAEAGLEVVENGDVKIMPESANKSYKRWLTNINDWCISRQLWWGHRIPAYLVVFDDGEGSTETDASEWVVAKSEDEARATAEAKFGPRKFHLERDPDCLDTWFSAGLWPMATLGWPNTENPDFKNFFPTSLLETGWDILFFWVARMIMFSVKLTGSVPFTEVYCHSLIRDSEGRKMSKSLGNVIDPLDIINGIELESLHAKLLVGNLQENEVARATKYQKIAFPKGIPECGADALRFALVSYTTGGGDINFDIQVMHAYRRFCNKIWQASKYILGKLPEDFVPIAITKSEVAKLSVPERWILHRMNSATKDINEALNMREFSKSTKVIYQFFYDELCDVFIENSKSILSNSTPDQQNSIHQVLFLVLDTSLRLMHPFMPFITEELWQRLPRQKGGAPTIMLAPYPEYDTGLDFHVDALNYELGLSCARGIRSLAAEYGIRADGRAYIKAGTANGQTNASAQLPTIKALCGKGIDEVHLIGHEVANDALPKGCAVFVISSDIAVLLEVGSRLTDVDSEIVKLRTKLQKSHAVAEKLRELLSRDGFEENASDVVVSAEKKKLDDAQAATENYQRTLEEFEKLKIV